MAEPILSIRDLCVDYISTRGPVRALDRVSLDLGVGEVLGVAGESGCGKSTMAQAILRILPPPAVISGVQVLFEGRDLLTLPEPELRRLRWERIAMVFQSAMDALNPVLTVGEQIADTLQAHGAAVSSRTTLRRAAELLEMVGIDPDRLGSYPHQLSGGMRQRVGIAMALALSPALIILDEPTTALDVIVEREILEEIQGLQRKLGFAVMFITHDLTRMLQFSGRVAILYAARLVEVAPAEEIRVSARHPYTQGLLRAFPSVHGGDVELSSIPGSPPSLNDPPRGCRFHPRCNQAIDVCRHREPGLIALGPRHAAACHLLAPPST
jgi:peptide/nickel transport system ATP-binding protein